MKQTSRQKNIYIVLKDGMSIRRTTNSPNKALMDICTRHELTVGDISTIKILKA